MQRLTVTGAAVKRRMHWTAMLGLLVLGGCGVSMPSPSEDTMVNTIIYGGRKLPPPQVEKREIGCPYMEALDGTISYRAGAAESARGVAYQIAITDVARECTELGSMLKVKVGIQGRLILGEAGKPGAFTAPVRVAVRRGKDVILSKLHPIKVVVPADDTQAVFTLIDESIQLQINAEDPGTEYKIIVGLDPQGQRTPRTRRR